MKFKLDENFGIRTQHIFEKAEHDAQTVRQELLREHPINVSMKYAARNGAV